MAKYLITGGTGSFGQAMTIRLLKKKDTEVVRILSRDEFKQTEMERKFDDDRLRFLLGDVRDLGRLLRALKEVDVVLHAAAIKRIEKAEYDVEEAIKTNVIGSINVVKAAIANRIKRCLLVSSDKAVSPINTYGMTKGLAERVFSEANYNIGKQNPIFSAVRYGNVINSRGSVIPLFRKQLESTKWVKLTDVRMTRFVITMTQALDLVEYALENMKGGEIFTYELPAISVLDLAQCFTRNIQITKIRPGEKLHEMLVSADEMRRIDRDNGYIIIYPLISNRLYRSPEEYARDYSSDMARRLTKDEIRRFL